MIASIEHKNQTYKVDLSNPIDISVPLRGDKKGVNAWYVEPMKIEPVRTDQFLGSVAEGGDVNFRNIFLIRMEMEHIQNVLGTFLKRYTR